MSGASEFPISRPVAVSDLLRGDTLDMTIEADAGERGALANYLGIPEVRGLTARLKPRAEPGWRFILDGTVEADIVQTCVVTLEPLEARIEGPIHRVYRDGPGYDADGDVDPFDEDAPNPVEGGVIDAGAAVCEYIALEMEPYPRGKNAPTLDTALSGGDTNDEPAANNPFAALARIHDLEK